MWLHHQPLYEWWLAFFLLVSACRFLFFSWLHFPLHLAVKESNTVVKFICCMRLMLTAFLCRKSMAFTSLRLVFVSLLPLPSLPPSPSSCPYVYLLVESHLLRMCGDFSSLCVFQCKPNAFSQLGTTKRNPSWFFPFFLRKSKMDFSLLRLTNSLVCSIVFMRFCSSFAGIFLFICWLLGSLGFTKEW